jgi:hypothetical protein
LTANGTYKRVVAIFCAILYTAFIRDIDIVPFLVWHMGVASYGASPTIGAGINGVLPKIQ